MTSCFGLKDKTLEQMCWVFTKYPQVEKAVLHGSLAKGQYKDGSDVDVTLIGGEDLNLNVLLRIKGELDALLLPYMVDLSLFKQIQEPAFLEQFRRDGVVIYEKKRNRPEE